MKLTSLLYTSSYDGAFTLEERTGFTDSLVDDSDTSNSRSKDLLERSFFLREDLLAFLVNLSECHLGLYPKKFAIYLMR